MNASSKAGRAWKDKKQGRGRRFVLTGVVVMEEPQEKWHWYKNCCVGKERGRERTWAVSWTRRMK